MEPNRGTAVPERERTPTFVGGHRNGRRDRGREPWNWRDAAGRGGVAAATAQAARRRRTAQRLAFPAAWRAHLESLPHYDPEYTYDEGREYERDWTTDPDYGAANVRRREYDREGFVSPPIERHTPFVAFILKALRDLFGNPERVLNEPDFYFAQELGESLDLRTDGGQSKSRVNPDLLELPTDRDNTTLPEDRVVRTDQVHPLPEMAIEIVSPASEARDWGAKMNLYAALGIVEYLLCDPGTKPHPKLDIPGRRPGMWLLQLQADGRYQPLQEPDTVSAEGSDFTTPPLPSAVCGTHIRLLQTDLSTPPRFQWWDKDENRWRDPEADALVKLKEEHTEGEISLTLRLLRRTLPRGTDTAALDTLAGPGPAGQRGQTRRGRVAGTPRMAFHSPHPGRQRARRPHRLLNPHSHTRRTLTYSWGHPIFCQRTLMVARACPISAKSS